MRTLLAIPLALAACGGAPQAADPEFTITDSAGVEVVRNGTVGALGARRLPLREEMRVGTVDGPEHLQFYRVGPMAMNEAGEIFVANNGSGQIRVLSADGDVVRSIGRRGSGPGEYEFITGMFLEGDTLVVMDGRHRRVTRVDPTGALLDTWPTHSDRWSVVPIGVAPDGWLLAASAMPAEWPYRIGEPHRTTVHIAWAASLADVGRGFTTSPEDAGGGFTADDSTGLREVTAYDGQRYFGIASPRTMTANTPVWEPRPARAVDARGSVYISRGTPYRIDVFDAEGRYVRRLSRAHEPVAVTAAMADRYFATVNAYYDTATQRHGEWDIETSAERGRASLPRVPVLPALGRLLVSRDGAVWVERPDLVQDPVLLEWTREGRPDSHWDVFEPSGRFLGTARLSARFTPRAVTDPAVIGVLRDELDVEYVVRYRIDG